jgi:hypothetical protein
MRYDLDKIAKRVASGRRYADAHGSLGNFKNYLVAHVKDGKYENLGSITTLPSGSVPEGKEVWKISVSGKDYFIFEVVTRHCDFK